MVEAIEQVVNKTLAEYFGALMEGRDVSPAERYRTEGYLKASVENALLSEQCLRALRQPYLDQLATALQANAFELNEVWALPYLVEVAPVNGHK